MRILGGHCAELQREQDSPDVEKETHCFTIDQHNWIKNLQGLALGFEVLGIPNDDLRLFDRS